MSANGNEDVDPGDAARPERYGGERRRDETREEARRRLEREAEEEEEEEDRDTGGGGGSGGSGGDDGGPVRKDPPTVLDPEDAQDYDEPVVTPGDDGPVIIPGPDRPDDRDRAIDYAQDAQSDRRDDRPGGGTDAPAGESQTTADNPATVVREDRRDVGLGPSVGPFTGRSLRRRRASQSDLVEPHDVRVEREDGRYRAYVPDQRWDTLISEQFAERSGVEPSDVDVWVGEGAVAASLTEEAEDRLESEREREAIEDALTQAAAETPYERSELEAEFEGGEILVEPTVEGESRVVEERTAEDLGVDPSEVFAEPTSPFGGSSPTGSYPGRGADAPSYVFDVDLSREAEEEVLREQVEEEYGEEAEITGFEETAGGQLRAEIDVPEDEPELPDIDPTDPRTTVRYAVEAFGESDQGETAGGPVTELALASTEEPLAWADVQTNRAIEGAVGGVGEAAESAGVTRYVPEPVEAFSGTASRTALQFVDPVSTVRFGAQAAQYGPEATRAVGGVAAGIAAPHDETYQMLRSGAEAGAELTRQGIDWVSEDPGRRGAIVAGTAVGTAAGLAAPGLPRLARGAGSRARSGAARLRRDVGQIRREQRGTAQIPRGERPQRITDELEEELQRFERATRARRTQRRTEEHVTRAREQRQLRQRSSSWEGGEVAARSVDRPSVDYTSPSAASRSRSGPTAIQERAYQSSFGRGSSGPTPRERQLQAQRGTEAATDATQGTALEFWPAATAPELDPTGEADAYERANEDTSLPLAEEAGVDDLLAQAEAADLDLELRSLLGEAVVEDAGTRTDDAATPAVDQTPGIRERGRVAERAEERARTDTRAEERAAGRARGRTDAGTRIDQRARTGAREGTRMRLRGATRVRGSGMRFRRLRLPEIPDLGDEDAGFGADLDAAATEWETPFAPAEAVAEDLGAFDDPALDAGLGASEDDPDEDWLWGL